MTDPARDSEGSFAACRCDDPAAARYKVASVADRRRRSDDRVRRTTDDHEHGSYHRVDNRGYSQVKRVRRNTSDLALDSTRSLINGHEPAADQRNDLIRQPAHRDALSIDDEPMYFGNPVNGWTHSSAGRVCASHYEIGADSVTRHIQNQISQRGFRPCVASPANRRSVQVLRREQTGDGRIEKGCLLCTSRAVETAGVGQYYGYDTEGIRLYSSSAAAKRRTVDGGGGPGPGQQHHRECCHEKFAFHCDLLWCPSEICRNREPAAEEPGHRSGWANSDFPSEDGSSVRTHSIFELVVQPHSLQITHHRDVTLMPIMEALCHLDLHGACNGRALGYEAFSSRLGSFFLPV